MSDTRRPLPLRSMTILLVSLAAAWLLWSGLYKPLLLLLGAASCLLTFWLVRRMGYFDEELFALRFSLRLLRYWWWLGGEIFRSSVEVARVILDPKLPISPRVIDIKANHFSGAAGGSSRFDGSGCTVADLKKRHQTRGFASSGKRLISASQL